MPATLKINAQNEEIPRAAHFNASHDRLYTISQHGFFCVWDLKNVKKILAKNLEKETLDMVVCYQSNRVLIALENELVVLKAKENFPVDTKMGIVFATSILKIKLSENENFLAVATAP